VLRELRAEQLEETENSIVQAVLESSTQDPVVMSKLMEELRAFPWIDSVDWTQTESETE